MSPSSPPVSFGFGENKVRVFRDANGEPWFVGKDVARSLDYTTTNMPQLFQAVPDEWKGSNRIATPGGNQEMLTLSEQGLYFFLGRSDKPKALPFQKWLAGEVLPAIRKTGKYEKQPYPLPNGWRDRPGAKPRETSDERQRRLRREEEHCTHGQAERLEAAVDLWCELCGIRRMDALSAIRVRFDLRIFDRPPLRLHEEILNWISQQSGGRVPAPRDPSFNTTVRPKPKPQRPKAPAPEVTDTEAPMEVRPMAATAHRGRPRLTPLAIRPPESLRELTRDAEDCQRRLGILTHSLAITSGKIARGVGSFQPGGYLEDAIRDNLNAAHAAAQTALSLLKGIRNLCHAAQ